MRFGRAIACWVFNRKRATRHNFVLRGQNAFLHRMDALGDICSCPAKWYTRLETYAQASAAKRLRSNGLLLSFPSRWFYDVAFRAAIPLSFAMIFSRRHSSSLFGSSAAETSPLLPSRIRPSTTGQPCYGIPRGLAVARPPASLLSSAPSRATHRNTS